MTDWKRVLRAIAPKGKSSIISGLAAAMPRVIETAGINSLRRQAHFLAQIAHESDGFRTTVEYASGAAYEGRRDLWNTQPGDGKRFKGRGLIQLTGRSNYAEFGKALGVDLVADPNMAAQFPYAVLTAALYWRKRGINAAADADNLRSVTKKINGGYNGLAARAAYLKSAKRALAAPAPKAAPADAITADDLRQAGSRTMAGADQTKNGAIGVIATVAGSGAIEAVTNIAGQASDVVQTAQSVASNAQTVHEATPGVLGWLQEHWQQILIGGNVVLAIACAYFIWRIWRGASRVELARVDDANDALAALPDAPLEDDAAEGEAGEALDEDATQGTA